MEDRRENPRVEAPRVLLRITSVDRLRQHYLKDLSDGGAFIRVANPLPVGSALVVELVSPGLEAPLRLASKVVRVIAPATAEPGQAVGMAVKFDGSDKDAIAKVRKLVADHSGPTPLAPPGPAGAAVPPAVSADESRRLRGQVQGLVMELGATREAAQAAERRAVEADERATEREREANDLRARLEQIEREREKGGAAAAKSAQFERRVRELEEDLRARASELTDVRMELEETKGKLSAYEEQISSIERDEEAARALAERLAAEKSKFEKLHREDSARYAGEVSALRSEVEAIRAQMLLEHKGADEARKKAQEELEKARGSFATALKERLAIDEQERKRVEVERDELRREIEERAAMADEAVKARRDQEDEVKSQARQIAKIGRQLADAQREAERLHKRERDLSRLLAAVGSGEAPPDEVVVVAAPTDGESKPAEPSLQGPTSIGPGGAPPAAADTPSVPDLSAHIDIGAAAIDLDETQALPPGLSEWGKKKKKKGARDGEKKAEDAKPEPETAAERTPAADAADTVPEVELVEEVPVDDID